MEKKYQIFISSTYEDLKEERRMVQDTILSMYHFPIGMEMFSAADEEQWEIIKETIDSSDYYVLMIGHRYGSVIKEGEDVGLSYTQKEYYYAMEKNIPVLAFLIDEKVAVTPDKLEQDPVKKAKLEEFKKEVTEKRTVQWWKNKDDLANKVMNSLNKQINRGKRPGWIRTDAIRMEELQTELVRMSKKIRQLEEENQTMKRNAVERIPKLALEINDKKKIELLYSEYSTTTIDAHYMPLSMEDVPENAKNITSEMLEEYNKSLPSEKVINAFKEEWRFWRQSEENPFYMDIAVENVGNKKAKDIYIEICFPKEIVLYKKNAKVPVPEWPSKGQNPIDQYYAEQTLYQQNDAWINNLPLESQTSLDLDYLNQMDSPDRCFYNEDNSLSIRMENLMTGYRWNISDKYFIVPKKRGTFKIECSFMCEEYAESMKQTIMVVVE